MKTKFLIGAFLLALVFSVSAQESYQPELQTAGYKTAFKRNGAGDNWFIHLGAGAQMFLGDNDSKADLADRITLAPTVSVGKWFSPYWGVRLKGQGYSLHGFENDAKIMQHLNYYNIHLDAMWNLANYWGTYSPKKLFNFTPYVGLGYAHRFEMDDNATIPNSPGVGVNASSYRNASDVLSVNGGIQFGFRLSNRINLDFDFGAAVVPDYFDRVVHDAENEVILSATGGFTFKLGKTNFEWVEPMDYALINDLNNKINSLRAENDALSKRPVSCPECPQVEQPKPVINEINYVPNVVFFRLNSANIDANQKISIFNTAEFMKNSNEKIKVVGYADKATGSSNYNLSLSEKRARAVAKELTSKYNIPSENIIVEWKGSDEQPYKENNWNRVVIMSAR